MKTRYIPLDSKEVRRDDLNAVVYVSANGRYSAIAYSGKRSNHDWHYYFKSEEKMNEYINEYFERVKGRLEWKEEKKAERKAEREKSKDAWNVGDVLYSSWGYEQTNIDFYQIVSKKGHKVVLRQIHGQTVEGSEYSHGMADEVVAVKDSFVDDKEIVKIVNSSDHISLNSYASAWHWDGKPKYRSWYY